MKVLTKFSTLIVLLFMISSCAEDAGRIYPENTAEFNFFELVPPTESGVTFNNALTESESLNLITYDGLLQGAGVAVLDINNDGLQDIYFAGNMIMDRLYLNEGNMKFRDITEQSGVNIDNSWSSGICVVDINKDGYDDIYVCKFLYDEPELRKNHFYLNNKDNTFTEIAEKMGIADPGYSIMANFFDYDNDGDLDLYVANQPPNSLKKKKELKFTIDYIYTDRLFRNDGSVFTDVTKEAGIQNYNYALSASAFDYNNDGFTDIYLACDYEEPDMLFKNNGNGTFTNVAPEAIRHMSNFSMGSDVADINNDGNLDVFTADMVAEDNFRLKTNMSGMNPQRFWELVNHGYHYQYMFNAMHLNNGDGSFSEIAQLSGISTTDWSWSPLFIDIDQDGWKDLMVTNGIVKEVRNKDYEIWRKDYIKKKTEEAEKNGKTSLDISPLEISNKAPSFKIANYLYQNKGNLQFEKRNTEWNFNKTGWSQGAAYADFDNDGDIDMVINNMDMVADIYRNTANDQKINNYITISLEGEGWNSKGINSKVKVSSPSSEQVMEHNPVRGYMSTSQAISHFGLGADDVVSVQVIFPSGKMVIKENIPANQHIVIREAESTGKYNYAAKQPVLFSKIENSEQIEHREDEYDDYAREILLPYELSKLGPVAAKADVNGDGLEDFYLGGSAGFEGNLVLQTPDGKFVTSPQKSFATDRSYEDGGANFSDIDGDGDQDLLVLSGGNEFDIASAMYQDRLYINDGNGAFTRSKALPQIRISSAGACVFDMDKDGDMDIFIGGRQIPGKYGFKESSILLEQEPGGSFVDVTNEKAPILRDFGMVTSSAWADLNGDGQEELIVAGEWMPIQVLSWTGKSFEISTENFGLDQTNGWWNTIKIADINNDGAADIIAGNLGLNIKYKASTNEPFRLYVDDFDKNGTNDVYLGYYQDGKCYPVRGRQCSSQQMPFIKEKFASYNDFGTATIDQVLEGKISENSAREEVYHFENMVFLNNGSGKFNLIPLPNEAQLAPVFGILAEDFNKDGKKDLFMAGNYFGREVETTRSDAGTGFLAEWDEDHFNISRSAKTGVLANKDVRDLLWLQGAGENRYLIVVNNNAPIDIYHWL